MEGDFIKRQSKIGEIYEKIINSPRAQSRTFLFGLVLIACAIVHTSLLVIFCKMEIPELVYFNIFSVVLYISLFFLFRYYSSWLVIFAAYVEICIHSFYATVLLGWETGFPLYMVCMFPLVFFYPKKRKFEPYLYSAVTIVAFIILRLYNEENGAIYEYDSLTGLYLYNALISFVMVIAFSAACTEINNSVRKELQEKNEELLVLANVDPLTGMLNRRSILELVKQRELERAETGRGFCFLICDIDDFKQVNDSYGHDCGDNILKGIADAIKQSIGDKGTACRWGGEEFLILTECEDGGSAFRLAEMLRNDVSATDIEYGEYIFNITVTIGVASRAETDGYDEAITLSDKRLYKGKANGKDQVVYIYN